MTSFRCKRTARFLPVAVCALVFFSPRVLPAAEPAAGDYLGLVVRYAEALLEKGRDVYGEQHSPLFAITFDRKNMKIFEEKDQKWLFQLRLDDYENWGIRNGDRILFGANPQRDQNLYQILYALSEITGKPRYATEADRTLSWFFKNCQSPATGLFAWGEHLGWHFRTETVHRSMRAAQGGAHEHHEFARPWVLWERSFDLAPEACVRFARGLWDNQIADKKTGDFSRHAGYTKRRVGTGNGYPRHGGFYIATWAEAYERTQDRVFLQAIETLVDYYNRNSDPTNGAIPCCLSEEYRTIMWPDSNLSLAIDLWDAAEKVPVKLAEKMRERALRTDEVYLGMAHDFSPQGIGFVSGADVATLEPKTEGWTHTDPWATRYGASTDAATAMYSYLRYQQTKNKGYKKLLVDCARRYLTSLPDRETGLHPGTFGQLIKLLLVAQDLSGDQKFGERAEFFAQKAVKLYLEDAPVPPATVKYRHYEGISAGDTLMMSLLELWVRKHKPDLKTQLITCDR